jgi:hypothetical protein
MSSDVVHGNPRSPHSPCTMSLNVLPSEIHHQICQVYVTMRWVMGWLGNGFGCSMKYEQTCTMREPVYDQVQMASALLSKRRRESVFRTICNGGWTEVNKRLTKWNPTEHTIAFWTRGLMLHHCRSVWTMECLIKWCDAPRHYTQHAHPTIFWLLLNWASLRKAPGTLPEDGNVMPKRVGATIHN